MNPTQNYRDMLVPHLDTTNTQWSQGMGVGRLGKAIICVSLFSVIVFVSLACVLSALLRAFPA